MRILAVSDEVADPAPGQIEHRVGATRVINVSDHELIELRHHLELEDG